jgi:hypothetical protein
MSKETQAPKERKLFITTEEILNGTLQYLASKPYAEVAHLVDALRQSKPYTPEAAKNTPVKEMKVVNAEEVISEEV